MVNKLFVTSTKRNKMRPKRARARQHNRLPRFCWQYRICRVLIKNRAGFRSCHHLRYKVWRKSTLFVSIISISKEYNITHYTMAWAWTYNRMRATSDRHQRSSIWLRLWLHQEDYITRSATLVLPQTQKFAGGKISGLERKSFTRQKISGFRTLRVQSCHLKFRIQNL